MGEYSNFLVNLSEQLTSGECGNMAYIAGLSDDPGETSGRCCCTCNSLPHASPRLKLLRRLERFGLFNRGCLGRLAQVLEEIGRKDLADKCSSAEFPQDSPESGRGIQESGHGSYLTADPCESCDGVLLVEEKPPDRDFVISCPIPSGNLKDGNSTHKASLTLSETVSSSIHTTPTVTEFTTCCVQLELSKKRERFKMFGRKKPGSKVLPPRSESSSPAEVNVDSYDIVNSSDLPSPASLGYVSISPSSIPATPPSATPTSTASRDVSPLPCNLSTCHLKHSESDTPSSEAKDWSNPVLRGKSADVTPTARPKSMSCIRSLTAAKIFGKRRPFHKFTSDSQTKVFSLEQNEDSRFPPSFQWRLYIPNLLSKIAKKQTKPLEERFYARTQADNNKFCLELVLKLCPIGLDFERDSFCTLTVEVHNKNACQLSSQKLKVQVLVRAGEDCLKEVSKVCVVGESQRVPEFLSHEVLRCFNESWLDVQFNLHLQYELDGEDATWEFIGRDFVL